MANAGYSGKALGQKLGLAADRRVLVRHAPSDYAALVGIEPEALTLVGPRAAFDFAHVFVRTRAALADELKKIAPRLPAVGTLWISWPKKSSPLAGGLGENDVRALALPLGLVDVKVCAVDQDWSGLKLVWRKENRADRR